MQEGIRQSHQPEALLHPIVEDTANEISIDEVLTYSTHHVPSLTEIAMSFNDTTDPETKGGIGKVNWLG